MQERHPPHTESGEPEQQPLTAKSASGSAPDPGINQSTADTIPPGVDDAAVVWENTWPAPEPRTPQRQYWLWLTMLVVPILSLTLVLAYRSGALSKPSVQSTTPTARVVALVDNRVITQKDVNRAIAVARALYRVTQGAPPGESDEEAVLQQLIDDSLILQAAEAAGMTASEEEVTSFLEELKRAHNLTDQTLAESLEAEGATLDDLKTTIRQAVLVDRYIQEQIAVGVSPREREAVLARWLETQRSLANVQILTDKSAKPTLKRRSPAVRAPAPDFTLPDLDGNQVTLSDLRGQAILINFWATWCPPCRLEMPGIQAVYEQYQDQGFRVLAVDIQEPPDTVRAFVEEMGLTFTILLDETGAVSQQYQVRGIPTSFFVNRQGTIIAVWMGAMTQETVEQYALQAMGNPDSPETTD